MVNINKAYIKENVFNTKKHFLFYFLKVPHNTISRLVFDLIPQHHLNSHRSLPKSLILMNNLKCGKAQINGNNIFKDNQKSIV